MVLLDEWTRLEEEGLWIPVRAVPKERPQVGKKGAYYTERYLTFRQEVARELKAAKIKQMEIDYPVSIEAQFRSGGFHMQIRPIVGWENYTIERPTHVRGDVDNMLGGVMDALQDYGLLHDDKHVLESHVRVWDQYEEDA
jgi:Holliday junction resolvase RusA-like endonuclease